MKMAEHSPALFFSDLFSEYFRKREKLMFGFITKQQTTATLISRNINSHNALR